jgi:NADH:ubiquinone oxidoreductase subunit B-like Fe-S oxidoreductase
VGSCASGGGPWHDSYAVIGPVDRLLPVDACVPGCPPRPEAILHGVAVALGLLPKQIAQVSSAQAPVPFPRYR